MRKLLKFVTSRLLWTVIIILIQTAIFAYGIFWASFKAGYFLAFMGLSVIMSFVVFTRQEKPAYKMVWMFLIAVLPVFGGVLYALMANKKLGRVGQKKLSRYLRKASPKGQIADYGHSDPELDGKVRRISAYAEKMTALPAWKGNDCTYFYYADEFFLDLLGEIERAERFIFIEYFIIGLGYWWSRILHLLEMKAAQGVDVRVMYDDMGSINVLPAGYCKTLQSKGIKAIAFNKVKFHFNPRLNFRDHRKIFCIDGNVCYTGGLNLADEYSNDDIRFGYWKDMAVKIRGAAVWNFTCMFLTMWDGVTGDDDIFSAYAPSIEVDSPDIVQPFASNPMDSHTVGEDAYMQMISSAERYVWIMTPYLILDDAMTSALTIAARSGVDVRIIMPHIPDKKSVFEVSQSNYLPLIEAGVRIYEFTPGFLHSKMFLADDEIAIIGTTNMDYRSFYLHFELSVLFYRSHIIDDAKRDFEKTFLLSAEQSAANCRNISLYRKVKRYFLRLFSPAL